MINLQLNINIRSDNNCEKVKRLLSKHEIINLGELLDFEIQTVEVISNTTRAMEYSLYNLTDISYDISLIGKELVYLQPTSKPDTKTEYIKCDFNHTWEALKEFQEGGEFYSYVGDNTYLLQTKDTLPEHFCSEVDNLYKKVETPLKWYDSIGEKGVLCWVGNSHKTLRNKELVAIISGRNDMGFCSCCFWEFATPLTKAELLEFVDSIEEETKLNGDAIDISA